MKVVGIVGSSGSGKTTLISTILPKLRARGLRVSTMKHTHHGFDIDRPGKDSYLHRQAGAEEVMLVSQDRWVLMSETAGEEVPSLSALLERMTAVDLVLVEGFKDMAIPKIEVYRGSLGKPALFPTDRHIIAVASDTPEEIVARRSFDLQSSDEIAAFIMSLASLLSYSARRRCA